MKMTDDKKNFQSHFHSPKIPAPPLHGHLDKQEKESDDSPEPDEPKKEESPSLSKWFKALPKKKKILVVSGVVITVAFIAFLSWWFIFRSTETEEPAPVAIEEPAPPATTEASRLTGLEVGFEVNKRPVTAVMIENSPEARPQSGLIEAGVIYEAITEGGISRFMALFQDVLPNIAGPVRSARPYYLDYMAPFDAGYAHVGGSAVALDQISKQNLKDLDQSKNPSAYWRDSSRYSPHNMYTDVNKLLDLQIQKGWEAVDYPGLIRGEESKSASTISANNISINISRELYKVSYNYNPNSNKYERNMAGKPHIDAQSRQQLAPEVVIVPLVKRPQRGIYSNYSTIGTGKVFVFQNGTVIEGTWKKANRKNQLSFLDNNNKPLKLRSGQTWITLAESAQDISYNP